MCSSLIGLIISLCRASLAEGLRGCCLQPSSACPKWSCAVPLGRGFWVHGKPGGMQVGSGHHLVLASRPSQLPAAIPRGWCARTVGGPGCKLGLGVLPSGLREDLGVDATKWPARTQSRPPWEGGVYACAPLSVPGDPRPLLKRAQWPAGTLRTATVPRSLLPPRSAPGIWGRPTLGSKGSRGRGSSRSGPSEGRLHLSSFRALMVQTGEI